MLSFSTLSTVATLAFAAFSRAAPLDLGAATGDVVAVAGSLPIVGDVVSSVGASGVLSAHVARDDLPPVVAILTEVLTKVEVVIQPVTFLTRENATVELISAPLEEVKVILNGAVGELHGLIGQPVENILASVDGTAKVTVSEVATLLGKVICLVFNALGVVFKVLGGTVEPAVFSLLSTVGGLVAALLNAVLLLVAGAVNELLAVLVPIVLPIIPLVLNLNVSTIFTLLGLKL